MMPLRPHQLGSGVVWGAAVLAAAAVVVVALAALAAAEAACSVAPGLTKGLAEDEGLEA